MICWIDDNPSLMETVAYGIFPDLWRLQINSTILFFGDSYKREIYDNDFDDSLCETFKESLGDLAKDVDLKNQNKDSDFFVNIENVELINFEGQLINDVIQKWKSDDSIFYDSTENFIEVSDRDIEKIITVIRDKCKIKDAENQYYYALDLDLLFDDSKRIEKKNIPIISMAIYNYLNVNKIPCFLYSSNAYNQSSFVRSWKEIYKKFYKQESIDNVKIIYRDELTKEKFNPNALNDILIILGIAKGDE